MSLSLLSNTAFIFGTFKLSQEAISFAIKNKLVIDTATGYNNASLIGKALKESKTDTIIITKFSPQDFENSIKDNAKKHCDELSKVPEFVLIHSPLKTDEDNLKAFSELSQLFPKSIIGVSNFSIFQIEYLLKNGCRPGIVSIEFHPYFQPKKLLNYCKHNNILVTGYRSFAKGEIFKDQLIKEIADFSND